MRPKSEAAAETDPVQLDRAMDPDLPAPGPRRPPPRFIVQPSPMGKRNAVPAGERGSRLLDSVPLRSCLLDSERLDLLRATRFHNPCGPDR